MREADVGDKKRIVNEGFLDMDSLHPMVAFTFGGHPMIVEPVDVSRGQFKIYKKNADAASGYPVEYVFSIGYNPKTEKPQIGWEKDPPEDLDIRVAVDVVVAKFVQLMRDKNIDISALPFFGEL